MSTLPDEVHGRLLDTLSWIGRLRESLPGGGRGLGLRGLLRDMMILELCLEDDSADPEVARLAEAAVDRLDGMLRRLRQQLKQDERSHEYKHWAESTRRGGSRRYRWALRRSSPGALVPKSLECHEAFRPRPEGRHCSGR